MNLDTEAIAPLAQLIDNLGEAPKFHTRDFNPPPGHIHCACGKKFIPLSKLKIHNTPFLKGVTDCICDECVPDMRRLAFIVCVRCKSVVSRLQPLKCKSGFQIRAGEYYHTNACPDCVKNLEKSVIIEKYFYDRERGIQTEPLLK